MKKLWLRLAVLAVPFVVLARPVPAQAQEGLFITEFMALNNTNLVDEDGQYSDWIEIYNASAHPTNLLGWYLTDNANNLTKWRFPDRTLPAFSYLIVFASNKDRTNAGAPLHSNFALSGSGEYLALVKPDGTNIASQYAPRFPAQRPDISYGLGMLPDPKTFLVPTGATAKILVPTADIGTAWKDLVYDDSTWLSGPSGVGFDRDTNYDSIISTDIEGLMLGVNASAYLRFPFEVADATRFQELKLRLRYDDGFIAYLNGTEMVRTNAPANVAWDSAATRLHGSEPGTAGKLEADFDTVTNAYNSAHFVSSGYTSPSASIQAADAGSTGRFLRLADDGSLYQCNAVAFNQTAPGRYPVITADFDFRISNTLNGDPADGFCFILIPTSVYGTGGQGAVNAYAGVEEPNYPGVFGLGFDMYPHATQNDVSAHWNGLEYLNFTIPRTTIEMVAGQYHHCQMQLEFAPDGSGGYVTVTITPNVNTTPGTPLTAINRLFIPGLTNYDCRAEFAARTGGLDMSVDLDNIKVQFGYPSGPVPFEEFDLSGFLPLLQAGSNVLAIQGLNVAATNGDFIIMPELSARGVTLQTTSALYFAQPTPGAVNAGGNAETAPPPTFSVPSGVYPSNLLVELGAAVPGAIIHYTLNGLLPTETSPTYAGPIGVSNSVMLTARVFAPGRLVSPPVSHHYTLLDSTVAAFSSPLPLIVIDTFGQAINQDMNPRLTANFTVIDTQQPTGRATLLSRPDFQGRAGIEGRGQTSWGFAKKPYNVETRDEYDQDKAVSLLGLPADSDFALFNPYDEKTLMNDFLAYELFEKMGHYSVRRRYCEVFLNGIRPDNTADPSGKVSTADYVGVYVLLERIKIGPNRVDIQGPQTGDPGDPITGGYTWKKDKASPGDVVFTTPSQTSVDPGAESLKYHDPKAQDLTPVQRAWLTNHLNEFEAVLYGPNWRDPVNGYAQYIDVASCVDFHWIVEFTKQIDGYRLSDFLFMPRGGKIHFGPIWDWNLSFGNANYLDCGNSNGWYYTQISAMQHMYLRRLVGDGSVGSGDPDFVQKTIDRWGELRAGLFNPSNLLARLDQLTNYFAEAKDRDYARWPRINTYIWPNPDGANTVPSGTDGTTAIWNVNYATPATYAALIGDMKNWIGGRFGWIDSLYLKAPTFSRYSGAPEAPLGMYAPTGLVYYTTDGSDPRMAGGLISPNARIYTGPVTLPPNARVYARVWHTNAWSPPTQAVFGDPSPALAVTEIMYHPQQPAGSATDAEEFEFIELANPGASALDLTGVRVAGGIDFTFPGGPLQLVGTDTTNGFEGTGTAYTLSKLGADPGASLQAGGPSGNYLRLVSNDATNRNRITFDQTASGPYDKVTADFDFRGNNTTIPPVPGTPTTQDFEGGGTPYVLRSYDSVDTNTPALMGPDTGSTGHFIRLTRQVGSEVGGLFFDATASTIYSNVTITFDFRVTSAGTPADGFGFVFLNTANWGTNGATASSWSEEPNMASSIGIGFDVYNNNTPPLEPNANHVSVHWNGAQVANGVATPTLNLSAGRFHRAQVTLKFQPSRALVTVKISPDINGVGGPTETLYSDFVITGATPYRGRPAFCARTGGSYADQDIDNVNAQYLRSEPAPSGGLSLLLLPTATFGTSGPGTGTNHFTDLPAISNVFALSLDMNIVDSINDANLFWNGAQQRGGASLPPATLNLDSGVFHHAHLELTRTLEGALATLTLAPDVYGAGGPALTVFSNLLVAGFQPGDSRVEFAGRSGGQNLGLELENLNVRCEKYAPNLLAAGQRLLLVKNRTAFESRYGTGLPIAGEYLGNLDNAGDHIQILGRYGAPILEFEYDDGWYPLTDGEGFSLVSANPNAPASLWSDPANWRASSQVGGSPGVDDPAPPAFVPVAINEVLSHPDTNGSPGMDAIELYNPSTNSADVSYWYLTDNFNVPKKYPMPSPTIIPAGGYAVFYESQFNAPGSGANGFGLRAEGEEVYLFSADAAGNLTGYYHGFDFGPAELNVSFGRYMDSEGDDQLVAQTALTLGTNNAGPRVGPVVISEVMYHPPELAGDDNQVHEFIELHNISASEIVLGSDPTNAWRLRDAVDYPFALGARIPAAGYVVVVSFDPAWDVAAVNSFRAVYGLDSSVVLYGPYAGKLDNSSDRVELTKPGQPDPDTGVAPEILVDKVKYRDNPPWPLAADGMGFSLHRINDAQFGNDPVNWTAGSPTPGGPRVPGGPPTIVSQPVSRTLLAGQTASLSVTAGGPGPYRYQWRYDGNNLPAATNDTLMLSNVQVDQAGEYQAVVLNANGSVASASATLSVIQAATILSQPSSRGVGLGSNTTFSVSALGNGSLAYLWRLNGAPLLNATNASLSLTNVQMTDEGDYDCAITDAVGTVNTVPAHLSVLLRPSITQQMQPDLQTVLAGQNATFTLVAGGSGLGFRWRRNGATFTNALIVNTQVGVTQTLSSFTMTNVSHLNDADRYTVIVTNALGQTPVSSNGVLRVLYAPVITRQPTNQYVDLGTNVSFVVTFQANPIAAAYQWWFNGTNLIAAGANTLGTNTVSLAVTNVQTTNEGLYTLTVSNDYGTTVSTGALLAVRRAPSILVQPASQSAAVGATITFSVVATGAPPPSYRWRFNGTNLAPAGATSATLSLTNVQITQAGGYDVVLTNVLGSVTSVVATLTVLQPTMITGIVFDTGPSTMRFSFGTVAGSSYTVEYKNALDDPVWQPLQTIPGDGTVKTFEDPVQPPPSQRFYRVRTQ